MIVITDLLRSPIDEGAKVTTYNLLKQFKTYNANTTVLSINGDSSFEFVDNHYYLNKLLLNLSFFKDISQYSDNSILYIPEASATFFSFIRAKLLYLFTGKDVYVLSLQPRTYRPISKALIKVIPPKLIITQSKTTGRYFSKLGIKNKVLPLGVDDSKYYELDAVAKKELRSKFKIQQERTVLLHVGHVQLSRNLEWMVRVKERLPEIEIIIVGSTYNQDDKELRETLLNKGIRVIGEYSPNMEEIYNLADYYIFPVVQNDGAIETPLSVLEAMACNLPVLTTRFGSLPDVFKEDECFHYVKSSEEIVSILKKGKSINCNNIEKIKPFTWDAIAVRLVEMVE